MGIVIAEPEIILGPDSAGVIMTPEEFDLIEEYDENYRYELIRGVLVVNPIASAEETGPNELLGYYLLHYHEYDPRGSALDGTLPQQYVRTTNGRRLADRLIWTGLGRVPNRRRDLPTIAVEFVSAGKRSWTRDYIAKRQEYAEAGIAEYWIIDRFRRTLTVVASSSSGQKEKVIAERETYQSPHLPGFDLPLVQLLAAADAQAEANQNEPIN